MEQQHDPDSPGSGDPHEPNELDLYLASDGDDEPVGRQDGFTPKRRRVFLKAMRKTGCVQDSCRRARISDTAAYGLRARNPDFARLWDLARSQAGADLELLAWQYAVEGEEVEVWAYGKCVGTRRKRDPQLFRMLLQGSNPVKYGGHGFGSRKQLEKKIRRQIEEEQRIEETTDVDELRDRIARRIERLREREIAAGGWWEDENGRLIPAGYVKAEPEAPALSAADAGEAPALADGAPDGTPPAAGSEPAAVSEPATDETAPSIAAPPIPADEAAPAVPPEYPGRVLKPYPKPAWGPGRPPPWARDIRLGDFP